MRLRSDFTNTGSESAKYVGKLCMEALENSPNKEQLKEAMNFKEDNTMSNSSQLYTTALAKFIWYKSYNNFQQYYDSTIELTPADLGMPEGAGAYKVPKILGAQAVKLSSGQVVDYINDNKDEALLETETYGIGTRINRRLRKRGAKGFIQKLIQAGSDAVHREVCSDIANGMVAAASSSNTGSGGVDYDEIETVKYNIKQSTTSDGVLFGFYPDVLALSSVGFKTLASTTEFKNVFYRQEQPGAKALDTYVVWQGLKVKEFNLISVQKGGLDVHAVVFDSANFMFFLRETGMDTFDGRLPGTAGDEEIILAMDAGMVVANAEAGAVITA